MLQRQSILFLPTLREDPADAEAVSHKLLVRAGLIRQLGTGLWTFLPAGWRIHENVVRVIREEMDAIGGQEMSMPVLTPAELWEATGRIRIPELFRVEDRAGRKFVLPLTHEETITFHARELRSYRDLPKILYHFQTKDRDEPRPRGGLLRVREFVMKDAYSFDRDEEGLDVAFRAHAGAYERIFERCGLDAVAVAGGVGDDGRERVVRLPRAVGSGENTLVTCERGDYAADLEIARGVPRAPEFPERLDAPEEVETPGIETCEALAAFLGIDLAATSKAMPVSPAARSCSRSCAATTASRAEARRARRAEVRPATEDGSAKRSAPIPARSGRWASRSRSCRRDAARRSVRRRREPHGFPPARCGARARLRGRFADIRVPKPGDTCSRCGGALAFRTAIEVGHIFKLGTYYSGRSTRRSSTRTVSEPLVMGSYGIGPGRIMAAAVEQHHDEQGSSGPCRSRRTTCTSSSLAGARPT